MKQICIYHRVDLDGWMSAAIVKHYHMLYLESISGEMEEVNTLDFIGYNYGDSIPELSEYDRIIMCDISFPKEEMLKLWATKGLNFIWIDHHSAIKEMNNAHENISSGEYPIVGLRNTNLAACELTWKYFFPVDTMPEIVRLLGLYDSFRYKGTDKAQKVLEFQYGARRCISNYQDAYTYLKECTKTQESEYWRLQAQVTVMKIQEQGKAIYKYLCTEAKQAYAKGFEIHLVEEDLPDVHINPFDPEKGTCFCRRFICINKERFNPINFGIDYHADGYEGCACFWFANGKWNFSIYNDDGKVDCSEIAKQYGGGGHRGAAGFILTMKEFNTLMTNGGGSLD